MKKLLIGTLAVLLCCTGCSGSSAYKRVYKGHKDALNSRHYAQPLEICWSATKRMLLDHNFTIEEESGDMHRILAKRHFKDGKRTVTLSSEVLLEPDPKGGTTIFINAIETKEKYFVRSHSRFFLWVIPLPGGGGKSASEVQESKRTIVEKKFFKRSFEAISDQIDQLVKTPEK
ncbi:MAG: hypothetical protein JW937_01515 [Candidatus Omnitrophica bacterium]|nr:hypothetical protein [Candidatus Omnitrophota bacterium]